MRALLSVFVTSIVTLGFLQTAHSQVRVNEAIDRQCSWYRIADVQQARLAASVGIMTTDSALRQHLFSGFPDAAGSEICAQTLSQAFCNQEHFNFTFDALTATVPAANAGGSAFFTALDVMESATAPSENGPEAALGVLGAVTGGVLGATTGDGGGSRIVGGAIVGGAIGLGASSMLTARQAYAHCQEMQQDFTAVTALLVRNGLRDLSNETRLIGDMRALAAHLPAQDALTVEAMIEAMRVTADRVASRR